MNKSLVTCYVIYTENKLKVDCAYISSLNLTPFLKVRYDDRVFHHSKKAVYCLQYEFSFLF